MFRLLPADDITSIEESIIDDKQEDMSNRAAGWIFQTWRNIGEYVCIYV